MCAAHRTEVWRIYHAATEPPGKPNSKADLANFVFCHAIHIYGTAKAALVLMENREPYGVSLLARSGLESAFNMVAATKNHQFGPQRIAFEFEELSRLLRLLLERGAWPTSWRPTPQQCLSEAERIRREYAAPTPTQGDRDGVKKIERIAQAAGLSPFYDDDYRQLNLAVHSNQAGILNSASGFLVRKGMLALCSCTFLASQVLAGEFGIKAFDADLKTHNDRLEALMQQAQLSVGLSPSN